MKKKFIAPNNEPVLSRRRFASLIGSIAIPTQLVSCGGAETVENSEIANNDPRMHVLSSTNADEKTSPTDLSASIIYDSLTGPAGSLVYSRSVFTDFGNATSITKGRSACVIAPSGKGMIWNSAALANDGYLIGTTASASSHSISVRLASTRKFKFWIGGTFTSNSIPVTDGISVDLVNGDYVVIGVRNGSVNTSTTVVNYKNQTFSTNGGAFPFAPGDLFKASWNAANKTVSLFKNGWLFYTSPTLALNSQGYGCGVGYSLGMTCDEIQIESNQVNEIIQIDEPRKFWQRNPDGGCNIAITGSCATFSLSVDIEYQIISNEIEITDWTQFSQCTTNAGTWSATTQSIPDGGAYSIRVRDKSQPDGVCIYSRSREFFVGDIVSIYGQSNAANMQWAITSGIEVTALPQAWVFDYTSRKAYVQYKNNALQMLANRLSSATGRPALIISGGVGGQSVRTLKPGASSGYWIAHLDSIRMASGLSRLGCAIWIQGESDIGTAVNDYKNAVHEIRSAYTQLAPNGLASSQPFLIASLGRATAYTNSNTDDGWQVMRLTTQPALASEIENSYIAAHSIALPHAVGDSLHLTGDSYAREAEALARTVMYSQNKIEVTTDGRGPIPKFASLSRSRTIIQVAVEMNGCTDLTDNGNSLSGWSVVTSNGTSVALTDVRVSGFNVLITLSSAQSGPLKIYHLRNVNPDVTNVAAATASWSSSPILMAPTVLTA